MLESKVKAKQAKWEAEGVQNLSLLPRTVSSPNTNTHNHAVGIPRVRRLDSHMQKLHYLDIELDDNLVNSLSPMRKKYKRDVLSHGNNGIIIIDLNGTSDRGSIFRAKSLFGNKIPLGTTRSILEMMSILGILVCMNTDPNLFDFEFSFLSHWNAVVVLPIQMHVVNWADH